MISHYTYIKQEKDHMSNGINLLLTAIGCPGGPSIIKSLRQDKHVKIVGTDMKEDVPARYLVDKFYRVPPGRNENYIEEMLKIIEKEKIAAILPLATFELAPLSKHKHLFEQKGCEICVSDYDAIKIANDKATLYSSFSEEDFIPKFRIPTDWKDMEKKIKELGFPEKSVVIKPFVSHGSIGLRIIDNKRDLFDLYINEKPNSVYINKSIIKETFKDRPIENLILTEYLPGKEYGVDLLLDPKTNKVISGIVRDNGEVELSGVSSGKSIHDEKLFMIGKYIGEKIKLSYAINVDFKLDESEKPKVIEVNPRLPATSFLSNISGLNLPLLSVYLALGKEIKVPKIERGLRIYSYRGFIVIDDNNSIRSIV